MKVIFTQNVDPNFDTWFHSAGNSNRFVPRLELENTLKI